MLKVYKKIKNKKKLKFLKLKVFKTQIFFKTQSFFLLIDNGDFCPKFRVEFRVPTDR